MMKNKVLVAFFGGILVVMSFTNDFQEAIEFKNNSFLTQKIKEIDTVKVADTLVADTIDFNLELVQKNAHASYYHDKFTGRRTASGAIFNNKELTCAHKTLPFGTKLKVTGIKTGKAVVVTVTDRGPFAKDRHIDLSKKAFMLIAPNKYGGHIIVKIEIVKSK
jgi:rare lipoprotein A